MMLLFTHRHHTRHKYLYFLSTIMGQFITKVKVKVNKDKTRDQNFVFTLVTDGTEQDVVKTVNQALRQKIAEGELDTQNLENIQIKSDDATGFFNSFIGDVSDLVRKF